MAQLPAQAQAFMPHWIFSPQSDSLSVVWFRKMVILERPLQQAKLMVATNGKVRAYVCEANVGRGIYYPARQPGDNRAVALTWDVTPYLRPDTIVVAIAYCPTGHETDNRQVAACLYGTDADGKPFSIFSDETWLCRPANTRLTADGHEITDGRAHNTIWNSTNPASALWTGCNQVTASDMHAPAIIDYSTALPAEAIAHTRRSNYFDAEGDTVQYEFGTAFHGMVRITLREAKRGEVVNYDDNIYICSGDMDEQACPLFTTSTHRRVTVTGQDGFHRDHIVNIEALETTEKSMDNTLE